MLVNSIEIYKLCRFECRSNLIKIKVETILKDIKNETVKTYPK